MSQVRRNRLESIGGGLVNGVGLVCSNEHICCGPSLFVHASHMAFSNFFPPRRDMCCQRLLVLAFWVAVV